MFKLILELISIKLQILKQHIKLQIAILTRKF